MNSLDPQNKAMLMLKKQEPLNNVSRQFSFFKTVCF